VARALAPRKPLTVSEWADANRYLSSKGSAEPGRWRTRRNPPLREPMDCMSARSAVRDCVLMFPIQFGKTAVAENALGYTMDHNPGPDHGHAARRSVDAEVGGAEAQPDGRGDAGGQAHAHQRRQPRQPTRARSRTSPAASSTSSTPARPRA
jgi:hypothetical protein